MTEILFARVDDVDASTALAAQAAAEAAQAAAEAAAASLTTEALQDIMGAMFSGNTETLVTVTYQDSDGTIDVVVDADLANYDNSTSLFLDETAADLLYVRLDSDSEYLTEAEAAVAYQPLDADLTAVAALTTTATGRNLLELADPGDDRLVMFKESLAGNRYATLALMVEETDPAAGDYLLAYTNDDRLVRINWSEIPGVAEAAGTFLGLTDTPDDYTGQGGNAVLVKMTEDGLEFGTASAVAAFTDLTDVPAAYTGHSGKAVAVKGAEDGLEFISFPSGYTDEQAQDAVGGMLTGNVETLITVTYQDATAKIDFVVEDDLSLYDNTTSGFLTAATADALFLTPAEGNAAYQPLDADLTAIAALTTTAYGRGLLELADETALEALLDTLPNLTSIQSLTVTLNDAGADAVLGWDDSAGAYQNLSAADVRTAISVYSQAQSDAAYQPLDADLTSWAGVTRATGFDTFVATPTLANLGSLLTNEASGLITFMTTPTSANLASLVTDDVFSLSDAELGALAGLTSAADKVPYFTGSGTAALADLSSAMRTFMTTPSSANFASLVSDDAFSLADAELGAIAGLVSAADRLPYFTGAGTASLATFTAYGRTLVALADEDALEALLDTLPNLTSIQGRTVTLADAGANAFFGWDDTAGAYENLTDAEVEAIIEPLIDTLANLTSIQGVSFTFGSYAATLLNNASEAAFKAAVNLEIGVDVQAYDADLTTLASAFSTASAAGAAYLDFAEDTDNGTNRVRLQGAASTADVTVTLPAATTTLVGTDTSDVLTNKSIDLTNNTLVGSVAEFNTALESADFYTTGGTDVSLADGGTGASLTDPNLDTLPFWDDSAGTIKWAALADMNTEAAPAAGDYLFLIDSGGNLLKVNWSSLPGAGGGISNVVEDTTPQLGGDLDLNGKLLFDATLGGLLAYFGSSSEFQFYTTSAGATGVRLSGWHDSPSPADGDIPFAIFANAGVDDEVVGQIRMELDDGATGTEDTQWQFVTRAAGADLTALTLGDTSLSFDSSYHHTFNVGSTALGTVVVTGTDATGAGVGIDLYSNSASPADNDGLASINVWGKDDGAANQAYGYIAWGATDVSAGTEDSSIILGIQSAGSALTALTLGTTTGADGVYGHVFNTGSSQNGALEILSTNTGTGGPLVATYFNSTSPADGDNIGYWEHAGKDDGGGIEFYSVIQTVADDVSAGTEDSELYLIIRNAGADLTALTLGGTDVRGATGVTVFDAGTAQFSGVEVMASNTDVGGPTFLTYHNSASPAADDYVGGWEIWGEDSASNAQAYAKIYGRIVDTTSTSEDGRLEFYTTSAGADLTALTLNGSGQYMHVFDMGGVVEWPNLRITNSDPGIGAPFFSTFHNSESPADGDYVGGLALQGNNDEGLMQYASIEAFSEDVSAGTEDGSLAFMITSGGSSITALELNGSTTTSTFATDVFVGDNLGVLIGHTAQVAFVDNGGNASTPEFQVLGTGISDAAIGIARYDTTDANSPYLMFAKSGNATVGSHTVVASGEALGRIVFAGSDGTDFEPGAAIEAYCDGTPGAGDMPGRLVFSTTSDAAEATTERLRITSTGRMVHTLGQVAHFWVYWTANSTTILASHNVSSIDDDAVGDAGINLTTAFSSNNFTAHVTTNDTTNSWDNEECQSSGINVHTSATVDVLCSTITDGTTAACSLTDPDQWQCTGFGVSA